MAKTKEIRIWTRAYRPMLMGGNVHAPVCTTVEGKPVDLGRGFRGYEVKAPNGTTVIAEAKSGGIVGNTVAQVRRDVKSAKLSVMRKQVRDAAIEGQNASEQEPGEFWRMMRRTGDLD